jgi:hypothetical protein
MTNMDPGSLMVRWLSSICVRPILYRQCLHETIDVWFVFTPGMPSIYTRGTYLQTLYHVDNTLVLGLFSEWMILTTISV